MTLAFDRFESLPSERKRAVVDSATAEFAENDYAHASTAEIARRAGMSKSLLFFYFRSKRELYLYVLGALIRKFADAIVDERWYEIDDFFEIMRYAATSKAAIAASDPRAIDFFIRAFYPRHRDVSKALDELMHDIVPAMVERYLGHVRWDRFRNDVEPLRTVNMLVWMGDGYLHDRLRTGRPFDFAAMLDEFEIWLNLMKRATYKEEYL